MNFRRVRTVQDVIQIQEYFLIVNVVNVIPCGLPSRICAMLPAYEPTDCSVAANDVGTQGCEGVAMKDPST